MGLSKETQERINGDAEFKYPFVWPKNNKGEDMAQRVGQNPYGWGKHQKIINAYIAGATAENERAQKLVDALEWIKTYGPADDITVKFVNKALREFKDGKGKEAQPESPGCHFCGIEGCQSDHK